MSYKRKLLLVYLCIVIVPMLLFGTIMASVSNRVQSIISSEFTKFTQYHTNDNQHRFERDIMLTIEDYPSLINNQDYLKLLFNRYKDIEYVQIKEGGQVIYEDKKTIESDHEIIASSFELQVQDHTYTFDFRHLSYVSLTNQFRRMFIERGIIGFVFYFGIHLVFITYIIKSTLPDTKKLTAVANEISQGNYNFHVDTKRTDEIGDLYKAFNNMRASLKSYEANRKELITNISHDLKTPIATIKGYVTGIKDGLANTPEKQDKYLNIIENNALHLDQLINDLFLYSKLDVDQVDFAFKPLHFDKYIDYYIDELKLEFDDMAIDIHWQMPKLESNIVYADGFRLKQVLNNIISNSVKHMTKSEKIVTFDLSETQEDLVLTIKDNGKGISNDQLPYIFDRFYRVDSARNTSMGSSGIGLAIVKQIVTKHHGQIYAESQINLGTSIIIKLPKWRELDG